MKRFSNPAVIVLLVLQCCLVACAPLRSEFYRNETKALYEDAVRHYKEGDYDRARRSFEKVIQLDPDYGPAHAALGNLAMIEEDYDRAVASYQEALRQDPELEVELQPLLLTAESYQRQAPLIEAGIHLGQVYALVMEEDLATLNRRITPELPLELLASDPLNITPGQLGELRLKITELAAGAELSDATRLLFAYILFPDGGLDKTTTALIAAITKGSEPQVRQQGFILLGRLKERAGYNNDAVDAFLAAVEAGSPIPEVAHHLARLYGVDIATVLPVKEPVKTIRRPPPDPVLFTAEATAPAQEASGTTVVGTPTTNRIDPPSSQE